VNARRNMPGLAVLVAAATIGLAACGSGSSTPQVASLSKGNSTGSGSSTTTVNSATTLPKGSPAVLLNKWAACMRNHGDPNQATPTVNAGGAIQVIDPADYNGTIYGATGNSDTGAGVTCKADLSAAAIALRNGQSLPQGPGKGAIGACMQAHGVADFPPQVVSDTNSPTYQKASRLCGKKFGVPVLGGYAIPGEIELYGPGPINGQLPTVYY